MAKVLISFIGVGRLVKGKEANREYEKAKYCFNGKEYETSFVTAALKEFLDIDKLFLFGTMKSMWEEVYRYFGQGKQDFDENYFWELAKECSEATHQHKLQPNLFSNLSDVLGKDSKATPIHYGITDDEIKKNFKIFEDTLGDENLDDGDEVYLDITHSFRSLPIFATTAINLIKDVSGKKIHLKGIYYGMLDITNELGYVPIVDLSYITELQDWIKGAYAFEVAGNANLLVELLKQNNYNESQKLDEFAKMLSLNFVHEVKSHIAVLKTLVNKKYDLPEALIVPKAFKRFLDFFSNAKTLSDYQLLLAKWHYNKSAFGLSYLCLIESLISYQIERDTDNEKDVKNVEIRTKTKGNLSPDLNAIFGPANQYRKAIAHVTEEIPNVKNKGNIYKIDEAKAITNLGTYLKDLERIKNANKHNQPSN